MSNINSIDVNNNDDFIIAECLLLNRDNIRKGNKYE